jgi:hypothetical protein
VSPLPLISAAASLHDRFIFGPTLGAARLLARKRTSRLTESSR